MTDTLTFDGVALQVTGYAILIPDADIVEVHGDRRELAEAVAVAVGGDVFPIIATERVGA